MEQPDSSTGLPLDPEVVAGGGGGVVGYGSRPPEREQAQPHAQQPAPAPQPPRRLPSRRRSSFSVVPLGSLDASRSGGAGAGAGGGTSSTAVIVATSRLGAGASGVAFSVNNLVDGRDYVLKRVRIDKAEAKTTEALYNEPRLHARLKHGNVISYQYSWVEREENGGSSGGGASALCILLERADAEFWQMLVQPDPVGIGSSAPDPAAVLGVDQRLRMAYELSSALAAIHGAGVVHRDLSPWVSDVVWCGVVWCAHVARPTDGLTNYHHHHHPPNTEHLHRRRRRQGGRLWTRREPPPVPKPHRQSPERAVLAWVHVLGRERAGLHLLGPRAGVGRLWARRYVRASI
jgi:hypothetical protein